MKQILSLLLAFVFVQTQCWALSGGPVYPGNSASVSGTYAGVLLPSGLGANALGLFVIESPDSGLATGDFVFFASGSTFRGTILGIIDPDSRKLSAVTEGEQTVRVQVINPTTGEVTTLLRTIGLASGQITAVLDEVVSGNGQGNGTGTRLNGTGFLSTSDVDRTGIGGGGTGTEAVVTGTVDFTVDGFKQADNPLNALGAASAFGGVQQN